MKTHHTPKDKRVGVEVGAGSAAVGALLADRDGLRLERIDEYELQGMSRAEPFAAYLAAIEADLLRTAIRLEVAAQQALGRDFADPDCIGAAQHEISKYLRTVRQVGRMAGLDIRFTNNPATGGRGTH